MDLINFFRVLLRRWWLILGVTLLAAGVAWFVSRSKADMYRSQALLSTGITDKITDDQTWMQQDKVRSEFNNLIKGMTSRPAVSRLSYNLALHDMGPAKPFRDLSMIQNSMGEEAFARAQRTIQNHYNNLTLLNPASSEDDALASEVLRRAGYSYEQLMGALAIYRDGETDYVAIAFSSPDAGLSAYAANTYANEFIEYYKDARGAISNEMVADLQQIADQRKAELDSRLSQLSALQVKFGIYGSESGSSLVDELLGAEAARDATKQNIEQLQAQLNELDDKLGGDIPNLTKGNVNSQLVELRLQRDMLVNRMSGTNNQTLQDSLDAINLRINKLVASGNRTFGADPNAAVNRLYQQKLDTEVQLRSARASLSSAESRVRRLRGLQNQNVEGNAEFSQAWHSVEAARRDHEEAQQRYNDALDRTVDLGKHLEILKKLAASGAPESAQVDDAGGFFSPQRAALYVVVLFVMEYGLSVKTPSRFQRLTGLPLLGVLNHLNVTSLKLDQLFSDRNSNPSMEKFKQLLRKLRYEVTNTGAKKLLFTSAQSGDGKSLVLLSLAYSLSLSGKKILIVDTNFKTASLTTLLNAKPALEDCIGRDTDPVNCISRSDYAGLDILGCQGGDYSPSEVLYDDVFNKMLDRLADHYDFIMMEGAAINEYADTKELERFAEKVVAIFSAKSVLRQSDKESIVYLEGLEDKFLGAVLNDVDLNNLEL
ncbi:MAG: Wzz/FepE/Etk N-terminal domain-containing protein [Bacteroidia bacterium]